MALSNLESKSIDLLNTSKLVIERKKYEKTKRKCIVEGKEKSIKQGKTRSDLERK